MSKNESLLSVNTDKSMDIIRPTNEVFENLFQTKKWTDLTITLGSKSFSVHQCIICPAMPYFDTMMSSEFKESRQDHVTLNHPIDIEAFECLIKWAYSFKININSTNIHSLLVTSDYLQVNQVFRACCEYLDSVLNIETALEIKGITRDLAVGKLAGKVTALIIGNFTIISKSKEWSELPIELLTKYLEDGDAVGFDENEIVDAIIHWAEYKPDSRQEYLISLLKLVKWKFVDPTAMFDKIASHEMIKCNESCRKFFIQVFEFMGFQSTESSLASHWKSPRIHKYNGEALMAFVKFRGKLECFVQIPYSVEWKRWMTLDLNLSGELLVAATDENLYIYSNNSSTCIHLPSKTYQKATSVHVHSVTASSDEFFIAKSSSKLHSSQIIKPVTCSSSNLQESRLSIVINHLIGYKFVYLVNVLYFIGGSLKENDASDKLQKYDIAQSKWTRLTPMSTTRLNPHVAVLDGKIYVHGGMTYCRKVNRWVPTDSAEYYDPNLNKWFNMPSLKNGNDVKFLIAYCSKLYAFMDTKLKIVHIYDPKTNEWDEDSMFHRCGDILSIVSIPNLPSFIDEKLFIIL